MRLSTSEGSRGFLFYALLGWIKAASPPSRRPKDTGRFTNEEGQTTRVVEDMSGILIHLQLGPDGSILDPEIPDLGDTIETVTDTVANTAQQVTGGSQGGEERQDGGEEEPNVTEAAKQKAEELSG